MQALRTVTSPAFSLFGLPATAYGTISTHNIDGAGARTALGGLSVIVRETSATGNVIGCSSANLA